jgi:hypothetical protein
MIDTGPSPRNLGRGCTGSRVDKLAARPSAATSKAANIDGGVFVISWFVAGWGDVAAAHGKLVKKCSMSQKVHGGKPIEPPIEGLEWCDRHNSDSLLCLLVCLSACLLPWEAEVRRRDWNTQNTKRQSGGWDQKTARGSMGKFPRSLRQLDEKILMTARGIRLSKVVSHGMQKQSIRAAAVGRGQTTQRGASNTQAL